ncbi:hypothetical Protein YC6258_02282 [Gynuella sunshinyii YC6258]|uniref:Uncharacterized protein n=1 Tax=Gynuella sunshinyii YC6258 TaxID=1445510 RepID=A0A0C5V4B8_9GAMM|nr:hypothetical Protein YC6258_02282 [Gynuella sunshinyii YC6258]
MATALYITVSCMVIVYIDRPVFAMITMDIRLKTKFIRNTIGCQIE